MFQMSHLKNCKKRRLVKTRNEELEKVQLMHRRRIFFLSNFKGLTSFLQTGRKKPDASVSSHRAFRKSLKDYNPYVRVL